MKKNDSSKTLDKSRRVPLYVQCEEFLRTAITNGTYAGGEFLPPERTLSIDLGVNRLTLRKAIASLIKQGIIENIPGAGNKVRQTSRPEERTRVVSCIMLRTKGSPALSPYFSEIFEGLHHEASKHGYDLTFMPLPTDALWGSDGNAKNPSSLVRPDLAGVIILGGIPDALSTAYEHAGIPVVMLDKPSKQPHVPSVMPDNEGGGRLAADHLIALGHTRIGYLAGGNDPASNLREKGLTTALAENNLRLNRQDILQAGYGIASSYAAVNAHMEQYGTSELPTAFLAVNDEAAIGAIKAFQRHGMRIPKDLSVIGFDDIPWAEHASPSLTTLRIPRIEMGEWAMRLLLDRVAESSLTAADIQLPMRLIVRASTAAPRPAS